MGVKPDYEMMGFEASVDAMKAGVVKVWYKAGFKDFATPDSESIVKYCGDKNITSN